MSRGKTIRKVQKRADTKKTKINAAEVSRVSRLVLDEIETEMQRLDDGQCLHNIMWSDLRNFIARKRKRCR